MKKTTITFIQIFNPGFGVLMATASFGAQRGAILAKKHPYVYDQDFEDKVPEGLILSNEDLKYRHELVKSMFEYKKMKPEEWHTVSRMNDCDEYINELMFNQALEKE
jgi:hypothetical protein